MDKQIERNYRIFCKLNLEKLPSKLDFNDFKELGNVISLFIDRIISFKKNSKALIWCFSNVKKTKIFMKIFHANEAGREIYKEEIAKSIPEYSYKTIAKIIDEGFVKGYYISLKVDGTPGKDGKVKNIRPSEELIIDFFNLSLEFIYSMNSMVKKIKP